MSDEYKWFYLGADDIPQGPVDREQLLELIQTGHAGLNALVWRDGFSGWRPFLELEQEIRDPAAAAAAAAAAPTARRVTPSSAAVKQVAAATREVAAVTKARISEPLGRLSAAVRARPAVSRTQLAVGATFLVAAVTIITTLYSYSGPLLDDTAIASLPTIPELALVEEPSEPEAVPVRVKNPFDESEVFEFPPGTSEVKARNAVADVLLKRALERRATIPKRRVKKKAS